MGAWISYSELRKCKVWHALLCLLVPCFTTRGRVALTELVAFITRVLLMRLAYRLPWNNRFKGYLSDLYFNSYKQVPK